ncbi:MAG: ABC transporter ATP-binding protein, partial [Bilophila sp.]|nr:ABC transporter ATP-binding protein [Bilophila sp.]
LVLTQRVAVGMMPVLCFVALGRHPYTNWTGRLRREDEEAVCRAITDVGIESLAGRPVCELSDGERQKVKIARALAQEPQAMILDEATAFLDLPRRVELMSLLKRLAHESGRAVLLATHDLDLALRSADRLWLLPSGGPLREGVPEDLVLDDAFSATFSDGAIAFDKGSGAFVVASREKGMVSLQGDGTPAMWTYRALERAGYRVVSNGAAGISVQILLENGRPVWIVGDAEECCCASIEEMLGALNERLHKEQKEDFRG